MFAEIIIKAGLIKCAVISILPLQFHGRPV